MSVKTLRFGPLPAASAKDGSTPPRSAWSKYLDIPPDTTLIIVALPGGQIVVDQKVTRSFSKDFDPGKYRYMMKKDLAPPGDGSPGRCMRVEGDFLIDVTEAQWERLHNASPRAARASMTSEGPTWTCRMPGCHNQTATRLAAYLHEARDHFGIDPIKEPEKQAELELKSLNVADEMRQNQRRERGKLDSDILTEMSEASEIGS